MAFENPPAGSVTLFTTTWCGYCRRLKQQLDRAGVQFSEVDVEGDAAAAAFVRTANNGNETVPTVLFPDGSVVTNPTAAQVDSRLGR